MMLQSAFAVVLLLLTSAVHHARGCTTPSIRLISPYTTPSEGWTVHGSIAFAADANDTTGVAKVDFFIDGTLVYSDTTYPYGTLWNTRPLARRNYTLKAVVTNTCGTTAAVSQDVYAAAPLVKDTATGSVITSGLLPNITPAVENINLRDTSVTVGRDGAYYLSGTGADSNAWLHNEGIQLWRSTDLKQWDYIGLIWSFERDGYTDERTWWTLEGNPYRGVWAPEFQFLNDNYYIVYSLATKGSKLLKSTTGNPEGPYALAAGHEVKLFNNIDGSLFTAYDSPSDGYLCYLGGSIFKVSDTWDSLTGGETNIGAAKEGCFVFHAKGKYYISAAKFMDNGRYSSWVGISSNPKGPYSQYHEAVPCGGHNSWFTDACGTLWATFFGNDKQAPWREKPAIVKMAFNADGTLYPDKNQTVPSCSAGV